jgi:hypothetical protein
LPYGRSDASKPYTAISAVRLARDYPQAWSWLVENREKLEDRSGDWNDGNWFTYSRRQNLEKFSKPKMLVPYMVDQMCATWDMSGRYFVNVSTGGYGVEISQSSGFSPIYVTALLNSSLATWVMRRRSRAWRGGWFGARKGNLAMIPIATASQAQQQTLASTYQECCQLHAQLRDATGRMTVDDLLRRVTESKVADFDNQVFTLYGLSESERQLILSGLPSPTDEVSAVVASAQLA